LTTNRDSRVGSELGRRAKLPLVREKERGEGDLLRYFLVESREDRGEDPGGNFGCNDDKKKVVR
jgi:hypothetical protein